MIIPELEKAIGTFIGPGNWSAEDDDTILRYYRKVKTDLLKKYIDKHHTNDAIRRRFDRLTKKGRKPTETPPTPKEAVVVVHAAKKEPAGKGANAKNAQAPRWTDPEKEIIKRHIGDKDSAAAAWKEYSEKFPGQRNEHAVYLKWYAYKQQGKKDKPEPEKKGAGIKTGNRYFNKWKIPYSHKDPEYGPARRLCKKHGKPYPEALKLKEAADAAERQRTPEKVEKRTSTEKTAPHPAPDQEQKDTTDTPPVGDEVTTKSPQSDPGPAPARHITRGDKVRNTTAYPLFPGVGTVVKTSINGNEVLVDYGSGTEWLDRKNLELVPLEAKAS